MKYLNTVSAILLIIVLLMIMSYQYQHKYICMPVYVSDTK